MKKSIVLGITYLFIFMSIASAIQYPYNQKISIINNGGEIGYVKPYRNSILGVEYSYIEWQRYGFPIGYSYPIALIKGTTTALPFGIRGELLRVKIGEITSSYVDLTIDQSDIISEMRDLPNTLPENINAVDNELEKQLNQLNEDISLRINKAIQRNYHSSLHIIDTSNSKLTEISQKIKNKEAELAEEIGDSVIYSVLNVFIAPGSGINYKNFVNQIPSELRHDITTFLYNIEYTKDSGSESSFADKGIATLYIGNPNENKISSQFNEQLKNLNLPYFKDGKIIGKRIYSSKDIGIIAAIPEEKYWDETTLKNRWDADRIRLYKTLIAGVGNEGIETAVLWYNEQLELAKDSISSVARLSGGALDEAGIELSEITSEISKNVNLNPKSAIGFATIAQGWILTGVSSLQNPDFSKIDSLGYVVIVKKEGNSYRTLETWSITGDKKNYFLEDYSEIAEQVNNVKEEVGNIQNGNTLKSKITGKSIENSGSDGTKKENVAINLFKKLWGIFFK
ncbi:hypothetical protein HYW76_03060 [Candidatus Pacearchaeota archaeon]|nr:hypothetical protein [Candidatus Pacearchaeota archaeon]